jgi:hypothetical protein
VPSPPRLAVDHSGAPVLLSQLLSAVDSGLADF